MRDSSAAHARDELYYYLMHAVIGTEEKPGYFYKLRKSLKAECRKCRWSYEKKWPTTLMNTADWTKSGIKHNADFIVDFFKGNKRFEKFDLEETMRNYIANTLCVTSNLQYSSCKECLILQKDDVREFLHILCERVANELRESNLLDTRVINYRELREMRNFVFLESLKGALIEFIVYYRHRHKNVLDACKIRIEEEVMQRQIATSNPDMLNEPEAPAFPSPKQFPFLSGEDEGEKKSPLEMMRERFSKAREDREDEDDIEDDSRSLRFAKKNEVQDFESKNSKLVENERYEEKMKDFDGEGQDDASIHSEQNDDANSVAASVDDEEDCSSVKKKLEHLKSILKK